MSATALALSGWLFASSLGGLMSMRVSWLELSPASRLRSLDCDELDDDEERESAEGGAEESEVDCESSADEFD
jgi:hypothetical protein